MCREITVLPMASLHVVSFETVTRQMGWNQESGDECIIFFVVVPYQRIKTVMDGERRASK